MRQLIVFGCVGIAATLVHYCVALLLFSVLSLDILIANLLAYAAAVGVSFFGHAFLTFKVPASKGNLARFIIVSISAFLGSQGALALLEFWGATPPEVNLAIVVVIVPVISFFLNKAWVYR